jgi:uncharacterized short protein YbdD (DUF466 family)
MIDEVVRMGRYLGQTMRLMVGVPEYSSYLAHMEITHPGKPAMTYEEFFRERQEARYGGGEEWGAVADRAVADRFVSPNGNCAITYYIKNRLDGALLC